MMCGVMRGSVLVGMGMGVGVGIVGSMITGGRGVSVIRRKIV